MSIPEVVIACWSHDFEPHRIPVPVLPDGCRDLICVQARGVAPCWMITPLFDHVHQPRLACPETRMVGYRLYPDARLDQGALLGAVAGCDPADRVAVETVLAAHACRDPVLAEALAGLADAPRPLAQSARQCGLSLRSLQRLVGGRSGRPPLFWHQLARIRRAGRMLDGERPLAEVALCAGFADQAHLSRACRRWFGLSPARLVRDPELRWQLGQPGYDGMAIGEQSSTR
ncbi:helix-turn-helix domain-containing protein [Marichromatium bheemlicum]|uniref:AraC family transcriptional regulator n=1 Tax=Marichromatium bheemlicum TaxID=365339 RepID=A0ABX1I3J7_9GAMM|nr:helix-turn-helix domain-containing protein [Marichromatium bheemlicum]NKN32098.1 AraC family transcriptional regulator [Marichromatium bheemlicum]